MSSFTWISQGLGLAEALEEASEMRLVLPAVAAGSARKLFRTAEVSRRWQSRSTLCASV